MAMKQVFEPNQQIGDFSGGLNTKQRPNKIADNQCKSIISMDFVANSLQRAPGYTVLGTEPDATLTGKSLYKHIILAGTEVLVKSVGTYLKYLDTVDNQWYKLTVATFTANARWSFETFNGYMYGVNGVDHWTFWNGSARSTLAAVANPGDATITLATGQGARFPNSATSIMIQDDEISYTDVSGDTLTGVTGIDSIHPIGATVIMELDASTYNSLTICSQIAFFKNRMYAVPAATPNEMMYSKLATNSNPQTTLVDFGTGAGSGMGGFDFAPTPIVSLKAYISSTTSGAVAVLATMCQDGTLYSFTVVDSNSTTTSSFIPLRPMDAYPVAKQMLCVAENDLIFVDQYNHVRSIGQQAQNNPIETESISKTIEPSLELMDFSDGSQAYFKRKLYVTGLSPSASSNDLTFYHDSLYNAWGAYGHWDVISFARYGGYLCGLSAVSGNVWRLNDGYDANGGPYYSEFVSKDYNNNLPHIYKAMVKIRISGFITLAAVANFEIYADNSLQPMRFQIEGGNTNILGPSPNVAVGTVVFGTGVFSEGGGNSMQSDRREFVAELILNQELPYLKFALKHWMDDLNVDFEINDLTVWSKLLGTETFLVSKLISQT